MTKRQKLIKVLEDLVEFTNIGIVVDNKEIEECANYIEKLFRK